MVRMTLWGAQATRGSFVARNNSSQFNTRTAVFRGMKSRQSAYTLQSRGLSCASGAIRRKGQLTGMCLATCQVGSAQTNEQMRVKMNDGWKKAGWIGLGAVLGLLLSLNFSALAERDARLPVPYEDLQLFSAVFGRIKSDYVEPVSDDKLIREAINGMVHGLDPHSDFLDADAFKELQISTQGKFGGLGIEVGVEDGIIKVVSPIEDTPAFRAGIKSGDLIFKIDDTLTRGLPLNKAVEKMRGKPGTQITLVIARKDVDAPLTFNLTREIISFRSVRSKMVEQGYGYIRVVQFQEHTGEDVAKAIRDLYKQGELTGLVLDLRSDPGGLLNVSVGGAAGFLPPEALVVYTDGRTPDAKMRLSAVRGEYLS